MPDEEIRMQLPMSPSLCTHMIGVEDLMAPDSIPALFLSTKLRSSMGSDANITAHTTAATTKKLAR
jgi:hypothetical protein